jgi:dTDP-4-dehydrorhamnose 3,5-epimerase
MYNDPTIAIQWDIDMEKILLSEKDKKHPLLKDAEVFE